MSSSALSAGGAGGQQRLRLGRAVAQAHQALARQRTRVVALTGGHGEVLRQLAGHLLAQLDDDPIGRLLPHSGHGLEALGVARRDGALHLARGRAGQHGERHLGPHAGDRGQAQEQLALFLGGEAVELQRVVAQHQVGVELALLAGGGDGLERLGRDRQAVADPAASRARRGRGGAPRPCRAPRRSRGHRQQRRGLGVAERDRQGVGRVVGAAAARAGRAARPPCAAPAPWRPRRCRTRPASPAEACRKSMERRARPRPAAPRRGPAPRRRRCGRSDRRTGPPRRRPRARARPAAPAGARGS